MAKPNVWRADIHLTDRIIVRLTFYRLITGTQDTLSLSLPVALSFSVSKHSGWIRELTRGQDARTDSTSFCSACRSPHLASSPLVTSEHHMPASPGRWLSEAESVCYPFTSSLI